MKEHNTKQNTETKESVLSSIVLDRIEKEKVAPFSRMWFECANYGVWIAWALSVVFGAVSVAVLIYVGDHARFALFEATHETPLSFFVEVLPYMWILTFVAMGAFAYFNMRHTKCGYKYPMWQLLISSVVFSTLGGVIFHMFGIGYLIDTQLAKSMPKYTSLEFAEQRMWQKPEEGRLFGVFTTMDEEDNMYIFLDHDNNQWYIQTSELRDRDRTLLSSGDTVRVLGTTTDSQNRMFHACGVFPWMFDKTVSVKDMRQDRQLFMEKMSEHIKKGNPLKNIERAVFEENTGVSLPNGLCAELTVVKRMKL